jgi:hypothetical protein
MEGSIFDDEIEDEYWVKLDKLIKLVMGGINSILFFCSFDLLFLVIRSWNYIDSLAKAPIFWVTCMVFIIAAFGKLYCRKTPLLAITLPAFLYTLIMIYKYVVSGFFSVYNIAFSLIIIFSIGASIKDAFTAEKMLKNKIM